MPGTEPADRPTTPIDNPSIAELRGQAKCPRCKLHFSGHHLCSANHDADCDIRASRDGWDAACSCSRGRP